MKKEIFAYCHIGCVGGKSLIRFLRSSYGLRHLDVKSKGLCQAADLESNLKVAPFTRSLASHNLRPFVDFSSCSFELRWYAILRHPIERMISHYLQQTGKKDKGYKDYDLLGWLKRYNRPNWQINMLTGTHDGRLAYSKLENEFSGIGLNERYEESLFLFRERMGLEIDFFDNRDPGPRPPEPSSLRKHVIAQYSDSKSEIDEMFGTELTFYERASKSLFVEQIDEFGGEDKLKRELQKYRSQSRKRNVDLNYHVNRVHSKMVHPICHRIFG